MCDLGLSIHDPGLQSCDQKKDSLESLDRSKSSEELRPLPGGTRWTSDTVVQTTETDGNTQYTSFLGCSSQTWSFTFVLLHFQKKFLK